uniref:N-acetyltransferase domain-containing protein n=1 Tax=Setaria italica TaxID=4555 RepID=K4AKU0_SETIT
MTLAALPVHRRPPRDMDLAENRNRCGRARRWDPYGSTEPLLAFIRDVVLPHPWFRAICLHDGHPVARCPCREGVPCRAELGYVLAHAHWGRGVATAAAKRTVAAVFGEVEGLERVEALVDLANPASQRVLEKAVLRKYGVVRDMITFSFFTPTQCPSDSH